MAVPTSTVDNTGRSFSQLISGSNISGGNNDYVIDFAQSNLHSGFSIVTGTLTAMSVTILAYNIDSTKAVDITNNLFGVASLASSAGYAWFAPVPYQKLILRVAQSNATNAVYLEVFAPRR